MEEEWRPVVGYEGLYAVSNLGRIYGLKRHTIRRNNFDDEGYNHVTLSKDGILESHTVHRIVAEAFIPNPLNLPEVNHKDRNPSNNMVENLEWCDRTYNNSYMDAGKKRGKKLLNRKDESKEVVQYSLDGIPLKTWPSLSEAARHYGTIVQNICNCCKGIHKTAKGYIWKYKGVN